MKIEYQCSNCGKWLKEGVKADLVMKILGEVKS